MMFKLIFFVPRNDAEKVKEAIFKTGAGKLGNYSHTSFESLGIGQFLPEEGSQPFIGEPFKLEKVEELKVEILCQESILKKAIEALKENHPYEEPAWEVYKLFDIAEL